jgi:hypothetical protein
MSKKKGRDGLPKRRQRQEVETAAWAEADGLHMLLPGEKPSVEQVAEMTKRYQAELRASPLYRELVKRQGQAAAEAAVLNCRVELR